MKIKNVVIIALIALSPLLSDCYAEDVCNQEVVTSCASQGQQSCQGYAYEWNNGVAHNCLWGPNGDSTSCYPDSNPCD